MKESKPKTLIRPAQGKPWLGPLLVALLTLAVTIATLQPGITGPGVTCDELYYVIMGKRAVTTFRHLGLAHFVSPGNWRGIETGADHPPVHPPLGTWILGTVHHLFDPAPDDFRSVSITAGRFAPALALGMLCLLVGLAVVRREGALAGTVAAAAVVLVPRVFAHGHLATLDMLTTFFFTTAVLAAAEADERGSRPWQFALAGVLWGLTMLVRLHGVLLVPPMAAWILWRHRWRAAGRFGAWFAAGAVTFFGGWPWLWSDPWSRLAHYMASGTQRQVIHVFYWGQVWPDREVPWHYPLVMFVVTLPLGLLALGLLGIWRKRAALPREGLSLLALGTLALLLATFMWPGTPVYDGVRLFLMVFPLWAVFVGIGARWLVDLNWPVWQKYPQGWRVAVVGILVAGQALGLVLYHPCQLSHYSLLIGGLPGAERLGFEMCYWGDAVVESLLAEAVRHQEGGAVLFVPNLAPFHGPGIRMSSPALADARVDLLAPPSIHLGGEGGPRCIVVYRRLADLQDLPGSLWQGRVLAEYGKLGVWLARVIEVPADGGSRSR